MNVRMWRPCGSHIRNWSWGGPPQSSYVRTYVLVRTYVRTSTGGLPGPARRGTIGGVRTLPSTYVLQGGTYPPHTKKTYVRTYVLLLLLGGGGVRAYPRGNKNKNSIRPSGICCLRIGQYLWYLGFASSLHPFEFATQLLPSNLHLVELHRWHPTSASQSDSQADDACALRVLRVLEPKWTW